MIHYYLLMYVVIQNYSFPDLVESDVLSLEEGTFQRFPFNVVCEPPLATTERHVVSKETGDICRWHVYVDGNSVCFKVKRRDAGIYFISSPNPLLEGKASFELRVKCKYSLYTCMYCVPSLASGVFALLSPLSYMAILAVAPKYTLKQSYLEAVEGTSPSVSFSIISEPPITDDVKHTLTASTEGRVSGRFTVENDCISFWNVSVSDSGVYTISCCNDDDKVGKADVEIVVTPKPDSDEVSSQASSSEIDPSQGETFACKSCGWWALIEVCLLYYIIMLEIHNGLFQEPLISTLILTMETILPLFLYCPNPLCQPNLSFLWLLVSVYTSITSLHDN